MGVGRKGILREVSVGRRTTNTCSIGPTVNRGSSRVHFVLECCARNYFNKIIFKLLPKDLSSHNCFASNKAWSTSL